MRVSKWMTPKPFTLRPTDSLNAANALMKEKRIRRIPIVNEVGKVVGIVTDRDLKEVSPSKASTLDVWELHYVVDKLKVVDIMTKRPFTVTPETPIERAALLMLEKRVEGLPVLDATGRLVGILTEGDVFRALVDLTGVDKKRVRVSLVVPDKPGSIREVTDICREQGGTISSIVCSYAKVPALKREVVVRVDVASKDTLKQELAKKFSEVAVEAD